MLRRALGGPRSARKKSGAGKGSVLDGAVRDVLAVALFELRPDDARE